MKEIAHTHFPLQFITHTTEQYDYATSARMALEGGCRWIQLRMKDSPDEEFCRVAQEIGPLCKHYGAVFLLNDRVELVQELQADGVHLGPHDMPIRQARNLLGDSYIIGGTAHSFDEIARHAADGADYAGCGPFRFTTTKKNLRTVLGLEGYSTILTRMKKEGIQIPVVAIGGITAADIPAILNCGMAGIALSGTVLRAADPVGAMQTLQTLVNRSLTGSGDT